MRILFSLLIYCSPVLTQAQSIQKLFPKSVTLHVSNSLNVLRDDVWVVVPNENLKRVKSFNHEGFVVLDGGIEIASEYMIQGKDAGVAFILEKLKPLENRTIELRFHPKNKIQRVYAKRTQAELSHKVGGVWKDRKYDGGNFQNVTSLRVPKEHKDHSYFIRYEGPGWESDKVGYRFYLDQRNATDVFGKKTPEPILQLVGQDGFDSYHEMQPWGMDVMKVGKSLGIGSIGAIHNGITTRVEKTDSVYCEILQNGVLYSSFITNYYGWKVGNEALSLQSTISIHAGTHLTKQHLVFEHSVDSLCTGIVKDKNATLFVNEGNEKQWGYIATFGKQSLNNDHLGLVVFFDPTTINFVAEDQYSHIVRFQPNQKSLTYYFAGVWEGEINGITDVETFKRYIKQTAAELANPVNVRVIIR